MIEPVVRDDMSWDEFKAEANTALMADFFQRAEREDFAMIYGRSEWPELMTEDEARGNASMFLRQE